MRWINPARSIQPMILCTGIAVACCSAAFSLAITASQGQLPAATPSASVRPSVASKPVTAGTPTPAAQPQGSPQESSAKKTAPEFLVIIDPSHGGVDKGVIYSSKLLEKEITLTFARELRKELDDRGIAVRLLRETDVSLPMEKRAEIANSHHNAIYVAIHAGRAGQGVHVYSAALPPALPSAGPFVPWSVAQTGALPRSRMLLRAVVNELQKKKLTASGMDAPLRPLNNVTMPAIAVELAPDSGDSRSKDSQSAHLKMQNAIASAVATGIATSRGQMGVHP